MYTVHLAPECQTVDTLLGDGVSPESVGGGMRVCECVCGQECVYAGRRGSVYEGDVSMKGPGGVSIKGECL